MRPYVFDIDPANTNTIGLADTNDSAGATLALDGTLTSGGTFTSADGLAHRLIITDVGADVQTTATYTITGTDADGIALVEAIAGPGASASVETVSYFLTVATVTIASPVAGSTTSLGTVDEVMTKTLPINYRNTEAATYSADVTGTINYTVQQTLDEIHQKTAPSQDASWFDITALAAKTADLLDVGTVHASACRLVVASYTNTAEIQLTVMQNESI